MMIVTCTRGDVAESTEHSLFSKLALTWVQNKGPGLVCITYLNDGSEVPEW
jgi:hypothetical protein